MDKTRQAEMAKSFLARHHAPPVLLLPNAWDALSARLFVAAGFDAVATTSGGVAWALGYPDGEHAPWAEVVAATARIVRSAQVPVTADIEAGYGATPSEVAAHVAEIIQTGVVGINLEDGLHGPMRSIDDAAARLERRSRSRTQGRRTDRAECALRYLSTSSMVRNAHASPQPSSVAMPISPPEQIAFIPSACAIQRRLPHSSKRSVDRSISPADPGCPTQPHWNAWASHGSRLLRRPHW